MRPLFTIHAGEYLVGHELERRFPKFRVWIPSRDTGADLLVTDETGNKIAALQVKFSKDHLASDRQFPEVRAGGWWTFKREKIEKSTADFWVFVLGEGTGQEYDYIVISPKQLLRRYDSIFSRSKTIQSYLWITRDGACWETRGLNKEKDKVRQGTYGNKARNFTEFLVSRNNPWPFASPNHSIRQSRKSH